MRFIVVALFGLLPSGCFLAQDYLHTPAPGYAYGARWVKPGMARGSRLVDWVACGGGENLGNGFRKWIQPEPWDKFWPARQQHDVHLRSCMLSKGYVYKSPSQPNKPDECTPDLCMYP